MAPTFVQQHAGDPLYILQASFSDKLAGYTVAFWPTATVAGNSLTLEQTWQAPGIYLFLSALPASQSQFVSALNLYVQDPAYPGVRLLWIANPNDAPGQWQSSRVAVQQGSTTTLSQFGFRSVSLFVGKGSVAGLNNNQDGIVLQPPAGAAYLTAGAGADVLPNITSPITITFADGAAGCLLFDLTLDNSGASHPPDFDRLDVGCRFSATDQAWPGYGRLSSWRYPIFDPSAAAAASLPLAASLDPLNPFVPERTFFSFLTGGSLSGPALPSFYTTNMGYRLSLTPTMPGDGNPDNVPRLVFGVRALINPSQPYDPVYLTPAGLFTVGLLGQGAVATDDSVVARVLCGSSGLEYVGLAQAEGNLLYFFPGQPAYAPAFPAGNPSTTALTPVATTSWGYFVGPEAAGLTYYAQPNQAPLFTVVSSPKYLTFLEIGAATLPGQITTTSTPSTPPTMFPLVAFPGIEDSNFDIYQQFGVQVLSPVRRQIISQLVATKQMFTISDVAEGSITAGTPQGLLAEFNPTMTLTLAQSTSGTQSLQFSDVRSSLYDAFQSNQLFLVISSKADLQNNYAGLVGSILSIVTDADDSWQFDVFHGWDSHGTIAIFKFNTKALGDLVGDTTTWASADKFNTTATTTVASTQSQIAAIIADAQQRVSTEPEFNYFVNTVVLDPSWNGILFLRCDVPLNGLPDQIAGIAAGIDESQFYAHHLGVTQTPLRTNGNKVELAGDSSLFGLIYYNDPADLTPTASPYQFKVLSLKVLFFNSAVTSFSSQIELMADQFFSEPVTSPDTGHGENNIVLNGTYQQQGGESTYLFISTQDMVFTANSHVLSNVEVVKAQFVTVVAPDNVPAGGLAESKLLLWGTLRFQALTDFDLFSFGDGQNSKGGISYSGLSVDLSYDPASPQNKTFAFDASSITFDLATSSARPDSLYAKFPLALSGLVQAATANTTPSSLNYLSVDAPLGQSSLTVPWYGLVFTLNLGSAGALAAKAGFTATMLAAWGPNPDSPSVSIGLKLPGSGGSQTTFSLESVLKLKIRRVAFVVANGTYVLNLNNIALSVLGLTLPPGGQTNFLLFGDPSGKDNTTLGWYAGYAKNPKQSNGGGGGGNALLPGGNR